jgi:hypothetical protein
MSRLMSGKQSFLCKPFHFINDNKHTSLSAVSDANLEVSKLSACVFVGVAILACPLT